MSAIASRLGASYLGDHRTRFLVWAPRADQVELNLVHPEPRVVPLAALARGYFSVDAEGVEPGARYFYRLNGREDRPDPASRFQPDGVHAPSQVMGDGGDWDVPHWHGIPLNDYIIYELHVGTFTEEGTFDSVIDHLDRLKELGVTAIELLPVAQFPGSRNWGYDGVYPYAVHDSYGGPDGLRRLVRACHERGLAMVVDAVYNHLGPEGNYLGQFGHYFTEKYHTPWGEALNFDGPHSDEVRRYFIENALFWIREMGCDALRLDAVHAIYDESARPFLQQLAADVHEEADRLNRRVYVIEESNKNDPRHIQPVEIGGYGLDGVWADDFHHVVHTLLTQEQEGYYADYGSFEQLAKVFREGFVYTGQYSQYRGRRHGASSRAVPSPRFVISIQTHDQVGNRKEGNRLGQLVSLEQAKLAAATMLLSPFTPMLFMGEEYGETAPFLYFVSHSDQHLIDAVREGRREEFSTFNWEGQVPDPQSEETFRRSKLQHHLARQEPHATLWNYYQQLIRLRQSVPALAHLSKDEQEVVAWPKQRALYVRRYHGEREAVVLLHYGLQPVTMAVPLPAGHWTKRLDSADSMYQGPGSSIPPQCESSGDVALELAASSAVLLVRHT